MNTANALTEEQVHILAHALGASSVKKGKPIGFRNYFSAPVGREDLLALVALGYMEKGETYNDGKSQMYHVTELGIGALVAKGYTVKLS